MTQVNPTRCHRVSLLSSTERRGYGDTTMSGYFMPSPMPLNVFCFHGVPSRDKVLPLTGTLSGRLLHLLSMFWSPPELELSSFPKSGTVTMKTHCFEVSSTSHSLIEPSSQKDTTKVSQRMIRCVDKSLFE